jgi:hypothetical protein
MGFIKNHNYIHKDDFKVTQFFRNDTFFQYIFALIKTRKGIFLFKYFNKH